MTERKRKQTTVTLSDPSLKKLEAIREDFSVPVSRLLDLSVQSPRKFEVLVDISDYEEDEKEV